MNEFEEILLPDEEPLEDRHYNYALKVADTTTNIYIKTDFKNDEQLSENYQGFVIKTVLDEVKLSYNDKEQLKKFLKLHLPTYVRRIIEARKKP